MSGFARTVRDAPSRTCRCLYTSRRCFRSSKGSRRSGRKDNGHRMSFASATSLSVVVVRFEPVGVETTVRQRPVENVLPCERESRVVPSDVSVGDMVACLHRLMFGAEERSVPCVVESPIALQSDWNRILDSDKLLRKMMFGHRGQQVQRVNLRLPSCLDDDQTRVSRLNVWEEQTVGYVLSVIQIVGADSVEVKYHEVPETPG